MKTCSWCGKEYPDVATACTFDQRPLIPVETKPPVDPPQPAPVPETLIPIGRPAQHARLTAILCYVRCAMLALLAADFGGGALGASSDGTRVHPTAAGTSFVAMLGFAAFAFGFGRGGWLLWRRRCSGAKPALLLAGIGVIYGLMKFAALGGFALNKASAYASFMGTGSFTVNALIVLLVAVNRKYFVEVV